MKRPTAIPPIGSAIRAQHGHRSYTPVTNGPAKLARQTVNDHQRAAKDGATHGLAAMALGGISTLSGTHKQDGKIGQTDGEKTTLDREHHHPRREKHGTMTELEYYNRSRRRIALQGQSTSKVKKGETRALPNVSATINALKETLRRTAGLGKRRCMRLNSAANAGRLATLPTRGSKARYKACLLRYYSRPASVRRWNPRVSTSKD